MDKIGRKPTLDLQTPSVDSGNAAGHETEVSIRSRWMRVPIGTNEWQGRRQVRIERVTKDKCVKENAKLHVEFTKVVKDEPPMAV